jgi:hypothetical protein
MLRYFIIPLCLMLIAIGIYRATMALSPEKKEREEIINSPMEASNLKAVEDAISLLTTGDIVLRRGSDVTSYMLAQMNLTDKTYSHCGLVVIEDGLPWVYHSIGGEDNPDQELRRDPASSWFSPRDNLGFGIARFSPDPGQSKSLVHSIQLFYKERKKYDLDFDLETDDRLYCSEFVYKALSQAYKSSCWLNPVSISGKRFIGIDHLYLNPQTRLICQVKFK